MLFFVGPPLAALIAYRVCGELRRARASGVERKRAEEEAEAAAADGLMLTVLQEKLAEAHGLAMAAAVVAGKVEERTLDRELRRRLWTMQEDAGRVRVRCLEAERGFR